jgi:hypothetical protein
VDGRGDARAWQRQVTLTHERRAMKLVTVGLLLVVGAVAACSSLAPSGSPATTSARIGQFAGRAVLGISNGTPLAVSLYVNGQPVGTAMPGVGLEPLDFSRLPPLPWTVEARSPSGRILTSMTVRSDSVAATNGNVETKGVFGRIDLSCGRITIWAGYNEPSGPVPPSPAGYPGDCVL